MAYWVWSFNHQRYASKYMIYSAVSKVIEIMNMHKLPEAKVQFTRTIHTSIDSCFKMMIYDWVMNLTLTTMQHIWVTHTNIFAGYPHCAFNDKRHQTWLHVNFRPYQLERGEDKQHNLQECPLICQKPLVHLFAPTEFLSNFFLRCSFLIQKVHMRSSHQLTLCRWRMLAKVRMRNQKLPNIPQA